jgi:uncharacterized protein YkwD
MTPDRQGPPEWLTRRRVLAGLGAGAAAGLAGCANAGTDADETPGGGSGASGGNGGSSGGGNETATTEPGNATATPESTTVAREPIERAALERDIADRANEIRKANGDGLLDWDEELRAIARDHSQEMIEQNYFGHQDPMSRDWLDRYEAAGYRCVVRTGSGTRAGGECIARESYAVPPSREEIAVEVVESLRADTSDGALLADFWNVHGVGVSVDNTGEETAIYVTQNFC